MSLKTLLRLKRERSDLKATRPNTSATETTALFEDILNTGVDLRVKVTGSSMSACLKDGDVVTIRKTPPCSLQRGDLIFFKNSQGEPILHRLIKKSHTLDAVMAFQTKGDALICLDEPIDHDKVLGKVCRIERSNSAGESRLMNMESRKCRVLNRLLALMSVVRSISHCALARFKKRTLPQTSPF